MNDPVALVVVAAGLALVSFLLAFRLGWGGAGRGEIAWLIGRIWLTFGIWAYLLRAVGSRLSGDLSERIRHLAADPLELAALVFGAAVFISLLISLNRAFRRYPPPGGGE